MDRTAFHKQSRSQNLDSTPRVTIIIPSYNSMTGTKNIERTLRSLANQTYKNSEILIVDSYSTDMTCQVCRDYSVKVLNLQGNRSEARNYGMKKMHGEYVLFADTDHVLTPTVVEDCVNACLKAHADCVIIPVTFVSDKKTIIDCAKMRNLEFKLGLGTQTFVLFYSKEAITGAAFPESVELGEDMLFSSKVLEKDPIIARIDSTIYHFEEGTMRKLVLRSWDYGKKFKSTLSEMGARRSTRFLLSLSSLNVRNLKHLASAMSQPIDVFSFALYTLTKHASFALAYCSSFLSSRNQLVGRRDRSLAVCRLGNSE